MDWGNVFQGFVPTAMAIDDRNLKAAQEEKRFGLLRSADARQGEMHGMQMDSAKYQQTTRDAKDAFNKKWSDRMLRAQKGDMSVLDELEPEYNSNQGWANDGMQVARMSTPDGPVANFIQNGKVVSSSPINQQTMLQALQNAALMEGALLPGGDFAGYMKGERAHGLENRKTDAAVTTAEAMRDYRKDQGRLIDEQLRTGNWGEVAYRRAMGNAAGGRGDGATGGIKDPAAYKSAVTAYNAYLASPEYNAAYDSGDRARIQQAERKVRDLTISAQMAAGKPLQPRVSPDEHQPNGKADSEYRKSLMELGPQPDVKKGWLSDDTSARDDWSRRKAHLDSVFGVSQTPGVPIVKRSDPGDLYAKPKADPRAYNVVSKAGDGKFNVIQPDGGSAVLTWDQLREIGVPASSLPR